MFLNSPQIIPLKVKTNLETCFALQQIHCRYTIFSYKFCLSIKGRHPWNEADKHIFLFEPADFSAPDQLGRNPPTAQY